MSKKSLTKEQNNTLKTTTISREDRHTLLRSCNDTDAPYPMDKTITQLFEAQVDKTPNNIALVFEGEELTYRQLNEKANQLAHTIRAHYQENFPQGIKVDTLIGLYLDRSLEMVISILGVLKAGGAYVPISPEYPQLRAQYILDDTQTSLIITQPHYKQQLNKLITKFDLAAELLALDDVSQATPTANLISINTSKDLAYVMHTSARTGQPKGVMVEHKNVVNYLYALTEHVGDFFNRVDFSANYCFDFSITTILCPVLVGRCIYIFGKDISNIEAYLQHIKTNKIDFIKAIPSIASVIFANTELKVKTLLLAGEILSKQCVAQLSNNVDVIYDEYGPTESTVGACIANIYPSTSKGIAKSYPNIKLYNLSASLTILPIGATGELYIGGAGLARGYLNQPELTSERFIDNPFATIDDKAKGYVRLYKTGDLVCRDQNGNLEYLGRNDCQVNLRGYRIELGEIESALIALKDVKQAVVVDLEKDGHKYLAAYLIKASSMGIDLDIEIDIEACRDSLALKLPNYMLPATFTVLESIPLTINGKLDKKALPTPVFISADNYVAPRNTLENKLCDIWQDILDIKNIGIEDNFFGIGGDSITAILLSAACRQQFKVDIPLALLFSKKIIKRLAPCINKLQMRIKANVGLTQYPLSFAQERLLFIENFEQGSDLYNIHYVFQLADDANLYSLTAAFNVVMQRHPVLNSVYRRDEQNKAYQQELGCDTSIHMHVLTESQELLVALKNEISRPFDLTNEPSIRLHCYAKNARQYLLMLFHHIAVDGLSGRIFFYELSQAYQALCHEAAVELPHLDISYGDYALWQRSYLQGENLTKLLDFWQTQLSGYEQLQLPTDYPRAIKSDHKGGSIDIGLDARLSEQLRKLAKAQKTTLYTVLLSGFYITLSAMSGQTDILLGTAVANRKQVQTRSLIGCFVNTLVLRAGVQATMTIEEFITQVHGIVRQALAHQALPFERLVDALKVERDPSRHPIFQVMLSVKSFTESHDKNINMPFKSISRKYLKKLYTRAPFDLNLNLNTSQPAINGDFNYALSLFNEETINRISGLYQRVLVALVANQQLPIGDISLLSKIDRHTLLHTWNDTVAPYPMDKTLAQLFEEQVDKTPDNIALVFAEESLTYRQLNNKANQLAHAIRAHYQNNNSKGIKPDTLIGLYLDRSLDMVISILGVLKAGGAYVPISPEYPQLRVQFMLDDTQTSLVITQPHYKRQLNNWIGEIDITPTLLAIDDVSDDNPTANLAAINGPKDLAYIIYTSGTTGKPKGVMIEHKNVVNYLYALTEHVGDLFNRVDFSANYCFDLSITTNLCPLLVGSCIYIFGKNISDIESYLQHIRANEIDFVKTTPSLASVIFANTEIKVKTLLLGGEILSKQCVAQLSNNVDVICDEYGPTESTVGALIANVLPLMSKGIGKSYSNIKLYNLSPSLSLLPISAPGELYIGGAGLARGYLNQHELTGERFIENPFATTDDKAKGYDRLYKTGDLVRWAHDGNLEYLGRNDCQVKIRGYRIELGEIESALIALKDVKQAVVVDLENDGNKYLAAYLIKASSMAIDIDIDSDIDIEACRDSLALKLPDYMLPATFTVLDSIPLTINGKLDRRALPIPEFVSADKYVAPRNELEEQLCNIWQEVLGVKRVGIDDNFFSIGGDSIVSIGLVSKMRREGFSLQVKDIFDAPTVAKLSRLLNESNTRIKIKTEQSVLKGSFDLLPIQDSFFAQKLAKPQHFNQAFIIKIPGEIKYAEIENSLQALTDQHDMLRCVFLKKSFSKTKSYQQQYRDNIDGMCEPLYPLNIAGLNSVELDEKLTQLQSNFNYLKGPTWQAAHLTGHIDGSARLFFAFHHLIIDVVSWRIIAQDIKQLLTKQVLTKQVLTKQALPHKGSSYRQWIRAVQHYALNHQDERTYWQGVCADQAGLPALGAVAYHTVSLSVEQTDVLLHQANLGFHTQINDLLLSALAISLFEVLGSDVNHVTLEGHGREVIDETLDVSHTVGWFTSMYPVRLKAHKTISATIIHTKEMLRVIPNKGIGYGALHQQQAFAMTLPKISFNYLGQLGAQSDNEESSTWQISKEDAGEMIASENDDRLLVNINGAVQGGILEFNLGSRLSSILTDAFEEHFHSALIEVIEQAALKAKNGGVNTPSDYAVKGLSIDHLDFLERRLTTNKIVEIFPANSLQQGFISHALHYPEDDAYRVQLLLDYNEALDIDCYQQAWCLAAQRYPALRACFDWRDGLVQIITADSSINLDNFTIKDISHLPQAARAQEIIKIQQLDRKVPFDLSKPGLMRFTVIKQHANLVTVMQTTHHSISDGWSCPILLQQVHEYYNQLVLGMQVQIKVERAFVNAQHYYIKAKSAATKHWEKAKERFQAANDLNFLLTTTVDLAQLKTIVEPCSSELSIKGDLYKQLKQMCQNQAITLNVAVQFAWHKLLHIYSGDEQTIVGTTVSGRDLPVDGIESSVGLYINTLPLTVDWDNSISVSAILNNIQKSIAELNSYSNVCLADLQTNGQRLFHSLFVFENYPSLMDTNISGIENHLTFRAAIEKTDYPLSVTAYEKNESLVVKLHYSEEWLRQNQARRLLNQIQLILASIVKNTDQSHQQISLMDDCERNTLLHTWNDTVEPYPMDKTLAQLFEEQVDKTPNNIALVFAGEKLTYMQVNEKANQLAHAIRAYYQNKNSQGIKPDTLIGLYLDRSLDMVISILGVLKAGGAYVPISPEYPQLRVQYILGDTQTSLVITQPHYKQQLNKWSSNLEIMPALLAIDDVSDDNPTANLEPISTSKDLAYVIYTSGTTGTPKGVMVQHSGVINRIVWMQQKYPLSSSSRVLQKTPYIFDVSVWELLWGNLTGAAIIIAAPEIHKEPDKLNELIIKSGVTTLHFVPSMFASFCDYLQQLQLSFPKNVQQVFCSGEALTVSHVDRFIKTNHDSTLLTNFYGPTEASIEVTYFDIIESANKFIPIGRPISNTQVYVLNKQDMLVPIGATGELYIGGAGLARGYLNQPELTSERFIDNPFATTDDKVKGYDRLYKTGDLVRLLPDGNLEYLGRNDCQVKIRGYRIELGEIESALSSLKDVKQAVVIDLENDGHKYLAAYLIKASGIPIDIDKCRDSLALKLPDYMLPSTFTVLDSIPLTINGKLDRRALPAPEFVSGDNYVAPRNELEELLCDIWQEVLSVKKVGIADNFYQLGGNSITAIRLTAACREQFKIDIPLALLFAKKTIMALSGCLDKLQMLVIAHVERDQYPLSFAQERLLFIENFEQGSNAYHIPYFVQLADDVNLSALTAAFNVVIQRHPVLNSVYRRDEQNKSYQVQLGGDIPMHMYALDESHELLVAAKKDISSPFDLTTEASIRLHCYAKNARQYLLMLFHHIAFDGWSTTIFMDELAQAYRGLCQGTAAILPNLDISYGDYALWQRSYLQGENLTKLLDFWQQQLSGYEQLQLPADYPRPKQINYQGRNIDFQLDARLSEQLRSLAKARETTLYTVLLSSFYVSLSAMSGQTDVLLGTPSDNRDHAQTQSLIGFFVNTLVLRADVHATMTIEEFISQVHGIVRQAKAHQELPFERLVDVLKVDRDASRHPIFQVMFAIESSDTSYQSNNGLPFMASEFASSDDLYRPAKFDLSLLVDVSQPVIKGSFNYALSLFNEGTIKRISELYQRVLVAVVANQQLPICDISLLSKIDRHTLLHTWNDTVAPYPMDKTLAQLFEEQVDKTPNNIAIVFEGEELTYIQLNNKANQLAHAIRAHYQKNNYYGIKADTLIGLYLDRSLEMVISIIGVLKAGGAYVPISPEYPKLRVQFMFEDTQTSLIITQVHYRQQLNDWIGELDITATLLAIDDVSENTSSVNLSVINGPKDLAYIIYTSGTTGTPKGVMIEQCSVSNLIFSQTSCMNFDESDAILWLADYIFDASVEQLFLSLLNGAVLHIPTRMDILDVGIIRQKIVELGITHLNYTSKYLNALGALEEPHYLKRVMSAGECISEKLAACWGNLLINAYGPTESTVISIQAPKYGQDGVINNIGRPINNTQVYVLNQQKNIIPIGAPGELYIGGAGLARGYLNQPYLTRERFIDNPFATTDDKAKGYNRLYKTGDLVRWDQNGNLEYLGRNDCQVKIRGYRIELGEIESALSSLKDVKQAVVVDLENKGNKYLAAYLIKASSMANDIDIDIEACRDSLALKLPDYMLPATFTVLDSIPLTINGKLDRRALPTPEFENADKYIAPRNELEEQLCHIWQEVLSVTKVGIADNFFGIGGNSITAIRLTAACRQQFKIDISLALLFEKKTIEALSGCLDKLKMLVIPHVERAQYPLSFAQERLLFIENFEQGSNAYHIPYFVQLADVNLSALTAAFNVVIHRHPVLNSVYRRDEQNKAYQVQLGVDISMHMHALNDSHELLAELKKEISRPFDLTTEPSIRLHCYEKNARHYLLMLFHHIGFDGWSTNIFMDELAQVYRGLCQGAAVVLPHLDISYGDYALWQRSYLQGENLTKLLDFWQQQLSGYEQLQLQADYPRPKQINHQGRNIDFQLDASLSEQLRTLAKARDTTLYTVLLSSFYISLSAMSGQTDVLLGTPSDNRDHAQTQSLIGFFVNTLVLRADVQAAMTIEEFISQVHGIVTQAKAHQELPFERLVDVLNVERDPSRHPIFQVMFAIESSETSYQSNNGLPFMPSEFASSDDLYRTAKFDLSLLVDVSQAVIKGSFNYALSLFNEETIKRISEIYQRVLVAVVANQQLLIGDISLLSDFDRHTVLHTWNDTVAPYPMDKTITQLFEAQVDKTPDNIALVFEEESLTYRQLNNKANQLAHAIRAHYQNNNSQGIQADTLIGLYLDRSLEMVISILGAVKAGGAYVPISPEYPQLRVQYILNDTQTSLVITQQHYKRQLNNWIDELDITATLLSLDDVSENTSSVNLAAINGPKDLAYVIYTSGTTGTPKGVMIEHLGVSNLIISQTCCINFDESDAILWLADYIFDASVEQLFLSLLNGAMLHIPTKSDIKDVGVIKQKIVALSITYLHATPQYLNALGALEESHYLKRVMSGGERISAKLVACWGNLLINAYGPTESTVISIQAPQYGQDGVLNSIGRPINNTHAYVLNEQKNIVPISAPGELYIGGAGLARGYLNQPELTSERFIDNPFATTDDKAKGYNRLYKTGDLVRLLPDGNLEYLGRNDCQVKIRGYRIELGEIESALIALKDVKQAVVVDLENEGHKYLAAYLIKASSMGIDLDIEIDIEACCDSLALKLPDYMLPATFTVLDSIPLTINGKLDRRALPTPEFVSTDKYVAPRNELEEQLCNIWQEVLSVKKVGIDDNFFRIGGDSIVSIGLVSKMRREGFSLQVKDIFDASTVAKLSRLLNAPATRIKIKTELGVLTGTFDLLPIQDSFFEQKLANPHHFNQSFIIKIPGIIKYAEIEQALQALTAQHDMLRCVFLEKGSSKTKSYQQQYRDNIDGMCEPLYALNIADLNSEELCKKLTQLQSNFNYINGPTWQAAHLTGHTDGRARLFFAFHHLIIDVVSWRIIAQDIKQLLTKSLLTKQALTKQALTKQALTKQALSKQALIKQVLAPKGSSYRQWIRAVQHYALNHQDERAYWQAACADQAGLPALGTVAYHKVSLSVHQTDVLLHQANLGFHTQINDLLLSALAISLFEVLGSDVNHVTLEGHGREVIDETLDVSNTVGWFTSMYPVRLKAQQTISATIIHTKEMLSAIPNKGIGYGALHKQQAFAMSLPKISFNYLGQLGARSHDEESSTWQISQEDAGQMIASDNTEHLLVNINGAVQAGILTFNIASRLSSLLTDAFEEHFHSALVEVIEQAALKAKSGGVNTPSDYAVKGLSIDHLDFLERRLTTNKIVDIFHANSLQQGFISHALHYPEDDAYRVQLLLDYNEALDLNCYQQAWSLAAQRYPALRACFDWRDGLMQIITADSSINLDNFTIKDISHLPQAARAQEIIKIQQLDRKVQFDLSTPGLMRFTLIKQHANLVTVMQTTHHSISDGWSGHILLQEVHEYYNQLVVGMQPQIKVERAFVNAQHYYIKAKSAALDHWKKAKERFQAANDLNFLFTTPVDLAELKTIAEPCASELIIKGDLYKQLKQMCRNQAITLNVAVQFAWHKLLHIYSGDEQTIVGTTVAGRDLPVDGIESSVGLYINTLPLTVDWDNSISVSAILNNIQKSIAELNSYSNVCLADLQSNGQRLFHSLFVFENYPRPINTNTSGIENHLTFRAAIEKTDYPLSVTAYEKNESLVVKLHYSEEWLRQNQARRLLNQIQLILASIAKNTDHSHQQISLMDDLERHTLVHTWNDTDAPYPMDKTIAQLFEEQVDKTPDNVALVFEGEELTYMQINKKANQLAHAIRAYYHNKNSQGIKPDTLIGLYLDRSLDMVISILGVLKAGGAYVPISPEYPQLRVRFMLEDTQTSLIITQAHYKKQLNKWTAKLDITPTLLALDDVSDDNPIVNLEPISTSKDLAYVIYTSGTTGTPKGVLQLHTNVVSLFESTDKYFQFTHKDTWVLFHEYTFDFSVWELWGALLYGGQLIVPTKSLTQDTCKFVQLCVNSQVTILNQTPAAFYLFIEESLRAAAKFPCLRNVIFGGDKLNLSRLKPWWNCYAQDAPLLVNMYGITETTVHVTYKSLSPKNNLKAANIGKPLNDLKAFVLNTQKNLVPIGAPGELYIGGAGLARGYLNQAELTHQRFIDNPFATTDDKAKGYNRLYKTGDLVRWAQNGNLEYLGRNDCQVKIRGYRIELGEIESALSALKDVKQAVVVDRENDGNKYLAAYLIKASGMGIDIEIGIEACRDSLALKLPDYMLPATFTVLDSIPLTTNGKLDRGALPAPEFINADNYVAPRNELEEQLCNIWQEVLSVKRVGIDDNFFRIGGDSIVSIGLVSKMRREGFSLQVKDIFDAPTVAQLSRLLNAPATCLKIKTEQGVLTGAFDLLPIQAAFFAQKLAMPHHFNQSFMINIPGEIKYAEIEKALQSLTAQHDMLRCVFLKKESLKTTSYQQQYRDNIDGMCEPLCALNIAYLNSEELDEKLTQLQSNFNYIKGPTWQAVHLTGYPDGSARLFFAFHHLIIDVVSWRIIAQDIKQLLTKQLLTKQLLTKQVLTKQVLAPKGSSYRQWIRAVQHYALNHQDERAYWQGVCADQVGLPALGAVAYHKVSLSVHQTDVLLHQANLGFHTQINDLLLSALAISLFEVLGSDVNHVTLEGHGRGVIDATLDVSNTVGWFTSAYPVRLEVQQTISETIIQTKEMLRVIANKGIGYGALHQQQAFTMSMPKIRFNYLGQLGAQSDNEESSTWQISQEDAGQMIASDNTDHLLVNINGAVQNGILEFNIASRLSSVLTKEFEEHFHSALVEVIEQAAIKEKSGGINTLSDLKEIYLTVNETANDVPIFFLPPGEGGAESYLNNIIPRLKDKKIILFNNLYHESCLKNENAQNYYTYQTLATQYIKYIKKIQPVGPYELFGWSFGGVLAFEIARQLENNGDNIAKIILVDPNFQNKEAMKDLEQYWPLLKEKHTQYMLHYQSQCNHGKYITSAPIFLFKFLKKDKIKLEDVAKNTDEKLLSKFNEALACYYNKIIDNHINDYVDCSAIKIIQLTSTHYTWVDNSKDVDLVTKVIIPTKKSFNKNDVNKK